MAAGNPEKLKAATTLGRQGALLSIVRVPNSQRLFLGCSDFKVYEVDLSQPKPEFKALGEHQSYVTGVALAGSTLVSGSYDGRLLWWDIASRAQIRAVDAHVNRIRPLTPSP